jgi:HAD superfamily hydrolase (TIGR01490 family)
MVAATFQRTAVQTNTGGYGGAGGSAGDGTSTAARGGGGAFFDVDGTVVHSEMFTAFLKLALHLRGLSRVWTMLKLVVLGLPLLVISRPKQWWDGEAAGVRFLVWIVMRGLRVSDVDDAVKRGVTPSLCANVRESIKARIAAHQAAGDEVFAMTGNVRCVVGPMCSALGLAHVFATELEVAGSPPVYTGAVIGRPNVGAGKLLRLVRTAKERAIPKAELHMYGNSSNDIPALEYSSFPTAVGPSSTLRALALERSWPILE